MDIVFLSAKMGTNVNRLTPLLVEVGRGGWKGRKGAMLFIY